MGKVVYFGLFLLGCFVFGSSGAPVEDEATDEEPDAKSYCPFGAFNFRSICYEHFSSPLDWFSAETACQNRKQGGHLASFSNPIEEKIVSAHIRSRSSDNNVWIGFHAFSDSRELHWGWSDGSHYTPRSSLWDNRSPSTSISNQQCVALYNVRYPTYSARWSQYDCGHSYPYVCEYKPGF